MGKTSIPWCDFTFNAFWGCTKVSAACQNCYAERWARRCGFDVWGTDKPRRFFGEKHWQEPLRWNAAAEKTGVRRRVFCGSMCDVMEDAPLPGLDAARASLWRLVSETCSLDWLLLTKRPENFQSFLPAGWLKEPRPNVWLLTTAANQAEADRNIPALLSVPAVVHGLSCEPLLGAVEFGRYLKGSATRPPLDWVIVGGESGPHARLMAYQWARDLRDQARGAGVAFFMKQMSGPTKDEREAIPQDLQIREFPNAAR